MRGIDLTVFTVSHPGQVEKDDCADAHCGEVIIAKATINVRLIAIELSVLALLQTPHVIVALS
jgi:hypothetical protein